MSTLIMRVRLAMHLSLCDQMKGEAQALHKERHLRESPTVPPLRIPPPAVRDILHPQNV